MQVVLQGARIIGDRSIRNVPHSRTLITVYATNYVRPILNCMGKMLKILKDTIFYSVKIAISIFRTENRMILKTINNETQILFKQGVWRKYIYIYIYIN